jgi:hypothetical protein
VYHWPKVYRRAMLKGAVAVIAVLLLGGIAGLVAVHNVRHSPVTAPVRSTTTTTTTVPATTTTTCPPAADGYQVPGCPPVLPPPCSYNQGYPCVNSDGSINYGEETATTVPVYVPPTYLPPPTTQPPPTVLECPVTSGPCIPAQSCDSLVYQCEPLTDDDAYRTSSALAG